MHSGEPAEFHDGPNQDRYRVVPIPAMDTLFRPSSGGDR
jgi:hypothetical protein